MVGLRHARRTRIGCGRRSFAMLMDASLRQRGSEAVDRIVLRFKEIQARHGRNAIGVFGGGALTNEKVYLLGKLARVALGTSNIDYNGRFCMSSGAAAATMAFGLDRGLPFPLDDIPHATAILLAGANIAETMPPLMQYFEAQQLRGGAARRRRSAADADGGLGRPPSRDSAGHRRRARQRVAARVDSRRADRSRRTSASAPKASTRSAVSRRSTGRGASRRSRASRKPRSSRRRGCSDVRRTR